MNRCRGHIASLAAAIAASGCVDLDIATNIDEEIVIDTYNETFVWDTPHPCEIYLYDRISDEDVRLIQYTARVGDRDYGILYELDERSELPLRVTAYSVDGHESVMIEADDRDLRAFGADGALAYEVSGYDQPPPTSRIVSHRQFGSGGALQLLRCALPVRFELGPVPAFLRNRATGSRLPGTDVVEQPETVPPILEWEGDVTILGALLLQSACSRSSTWSCPCLDWADPVTGTVPGWCGQPSTVAPDVVPHGSMSKYTGK